MAIIKVFFLILSNHILYMIVKRDFLKDFKVNKNKLVFGRRKTGKSFYIENFYKYDKYFFIYSDKSIKDINDNSTWTFNEFLRYLSDNKNKKIVVDEFHRLDISFLDFIHEKRFNNLVLVTSSLHFTKNILASKSPILGLIYPINFKLIKPCEILNFIKSEKNLLEYAIFLREPTLIELYDKKESFNDFLLKFYKFAKYWSSALFGEIFEDEDRKISETYEGIVRAISTGKRTFGDIVTYLDNNGLILKNRSSISSYLEILLKLGVITKLELYGKKKKFVYKLTSMPLDFFFYIDTKYSFNVSDKEIIEGFNNKVSFYLEDFIEDLFSDYFFLSPIKYSYPNHEIDVCLKKFKKIDLIASIKHTSIDKVDLSLVKKNLSVVDVDKKYLIVINKNNIKKIDNIEVLDYKDIFKFCK